MATTIQPPKPSPTKYRISKLPYGMRLNPRTGTISGMPLELYTQDYDLELTAENDYGEVIEPIKIITRSKRSPVIADQEYMLIQGDAVKPIYLAGVNLYKTQGAPRISSQKAVTAPIGSLFCYYIASDRIDSNKQVYSLTDAPEGMSLEAETGLVSMEIPLDTSWEGRTNTFTVSVENSNGIATQTVSVMYTANPAYLPVIHDVPELEFRQGREIEPVVLTGVNIKVNAGLATITSPDEVSGELGGDLTYQVVTNYIDDMGQTYFLDEEDTPVGMKINAETGEVRWEDIPPNTTISEPVTFTVGVENSYGITIKQVKASIKIPEYYKPVIDDQEVVVVRTTPMFPHKVKGTNIYSNIDDWKPVINDPEEVDIRKDVPMFPYNILGTNIYVNYGRSE